MQDSRSYDLMSSLENHGFNATVEEIGNPVAGIQEWVEFIVGSAGGYVGNIRTADHANTGLLAFVPSDDESGDFTEPCGRFYSEILGMDATAAIPRPKLTARHVKSVGDLLVRLASKFPPLEASYLLDGISIDLARSRHTLATKSGLVAEQNKHRLTIVADGTTVDVDPDAAGRQDIAATKASKSIGERIIRSRAGIPDGPAPSGFVLSASDHGDCLIYVSDFECFPVMPKIAFTDTAVRITAGSTIVLQTQNTSKHLSGLLIGNRVTLVGKEKGAAFSVPMSVSNF